VQQALGEGTAAPGLLASGGALDVATLHSAYSQGIFPWFSAGQPVLWWSPHPRMVLAPAGFKLHRSLRRVLVQFSRTANCEIRVDTAFADVITACASSPRDALHTCAQQAPARRTADPASTWIVPAMVEAYIALHRAGLAHSVETWVNGELIGGLYCVALGKAVFGESMFSHTTDASKIALAALVCFCRHHDITLIDCQQNTGHLASLGAREIDRAAFLAHVTRSTCETAPHWKFDNLYWLELLKPPPAPIAS
jgi:leucyl/phenylalanyl-tRNA--protein transferase